MPTGLQHFIPLNEESPLSTRGHALPEVLQRRAIPTSTPNQLLRGRQPIEYRSEDEIGGLKDDFQHARTSVFANGERRRTSPSPDLLLTPQMRSMRLIGHSNPRYRWQQYYKSREELKKMKKSVRRYHERNNFLISQYLYIDRLLDSSLPHSLIQEYNHSSRFAPNVPRTIQEECQESQDFSESEHRQSGSPARGANAQGKVKRTPKNLYKVLDESEPLLADEENGLEISYEDKADMESGSPVVTVAIYVNLAANVALLAGKLVVIVLTSSLSVLASLVDALLDLLSTVIVWITTKLVARQDQYSYPIGRRRLEPIGVLVFSVIMITSFCQVGLECLSRLTSGDHSVVTISTPAIVIMLSTVVVKGFCWLWCRLVKNSSVQALAQDAATDVVFNTFSIIFPLIGYYAQVWWLDALGGLFLSLYVIFNWMSTSSEHIRHLTGAAASADQRNILLYLTMRFARTIRYIQGLQAYHAGDKLNVEVDIVLDEDMSLRDSHDLSESLQYIVESVPMVDRAFVHADYQTVNLPSHLDQHE